VVVCLERGADLDMTQLMPLPLTVSCFSKILIGLPFWYRLTRLVPEKGSLNGCVCVTCRLTAKNRDLFRNSTLDNRVWATITFFWTSLLRLFECSGVPALVLWLLEKFYFRQLSPVYLSNDSREYKGLMIFCTGNVTHELMII